MSGPLACLGLGYVASRLARAAAADGTAVRGATGDAARRRLLRAAGVDARPRTPAGEGRALGGAAALVVSAPPGDDGCPVLARHGDRLRASPPGWVAYLSSTSVYGDRGGAWVDEGTPPAPSSPRGGRRLAAEEAWRAFGEDAGVPVARFRVAGIYGPGRSPFARVRAGRALRIAKPGHAFSRIHVDDIVRVLLASLGARPAGAFNLADSRPAPQADVIAEACRLLGLPAPPEVPFAEAKETMPEGALGFWRENRRVRGERILEELGLELLHPDYRAGLAATLEEEEAGAGPARSGASTA